jgi:hypothetical protein
LLNQPVELNNYRKRKSPKIEHHAYLIINFLPLLILNKVLRV